MKNSVLCIAVVLTFSPVRGPAECTFKWQPGEGIPGVHGGSGPPGYIAAATTWDPDGLGPQPEILVVGGRFSLAGGESVSHIAGWNGSNWESLGGGMNDLVSALAVYNGELIAGGVFTLAGEVAVNHIARWDGTRWHPLDSGVIHDERPSVSTVRSLVVFDGDLIAGGAFTSAGGAPASYVARWNGENWQPLGVGTAGNLRGIYALAVYDEELIVAGDFNSAGGVDTKAIAAWDGFNWQSLGAGLTNERPRVLALTVYDGKLIAGGMFTSAGNQPANYVASWDGMNWEPVGSGVDRWVHALTVHKGELIAGGRFGEAGDQEVNAIARWNGMKWRPLGSGVGQTSSGEIPWVGALTVFNGELVAGGSFQSAGDIYLFNLAGWNGINWQPVDSGMNAEARALIVYDGQLIAGGAFTAVGGVSANRIARWNGQCWESMGSGIKGRPIYTERYVTVRALTVHDGNLIAGGFFTNAGGVEAMNIARWDGTEWHPLGRGINSVGFVFVTALTVFRGELIAGGNFHKVDKDVPAKGIARWDGANWQPIGSGINGSVRALTVYNGDLIAGGTIVSAEHPEVNQIMRWDGTTWHTLGSGTNILNGPHNEQSPINAFTIYDGKLIAGGYFTTIGGSAANCVARWDGLNWEPMDNPIIFSVQSLAPYQGELVVGGLGHLTRWDGAIWSPMSVAYGRNVRALSVFGNDLIVGGEFLEALSSPLPYHLASWHPSGLQGDADGNGSVGPSDAFAWSGCLSDPSSPDALPEVSTECRCTLNTDGDADVDLRDFAAFQNAFGEIGDTRTAGNPPAVDMP